MTTSDKIQALKESHKKDTMLSMNVKSDSTGRIDQVLCWLCATPIAGWVDMDVVNSSEADGKKIIKVRQAFAPYNNYRKVGFKLKSGSSYSPVFCASCSPTVNIEVGKKILERDAVIAFGKTNGQLSAEYLLDDEVISCKGVI